LYVHVYKIYTVMIDSTSRNHVAY